MIWQVCNCSVDGLVLDLAIVIGTSAKGPNLSAISFINLTRNACADCDRVE